MEFVVSRKAPPFAGLVNDVPRYEHRVAITVFVRNTRPFDCIRIR